jgi:hypothetical protein
MATTINSDSTDRDTAVMMAIEYYGDEIQFASRFQCEELLLEVQRSFVRMKD